MSLTKFIYRSAYLSISGSPSIFVVTVIVHSKAFAFLAGWFLVGGWGWGWGGGADSPVGASLM